MFCNIGLYLKKAIRVYGGIRSIGGMVLTGDVHVLREGPLSTRAQVERGPSPNTCTRRPPIGMMIPEAV